MYNFIVGFRVPRKIMADKDKKEIVHVIKKRVFLVIDEETIVYLIPTTKKSCFFVIRAQIRKPAYTFLSLLKGYYLINFGVSPWTYDDGCMSIYELVTAPRLSWSMRDWIANSNHSDIGAELSTVFAKTGFFIGEEYLVDGEYYDLKYFVKTYWNDSILIEALDNLYYSLKLFDGNILNDFPTYEFRENPPRFSNELLDKSYLEFRAKFELSFLCAYKGIERVFGVNSISKNNIENLLSQLGISPDKEYQCKYLRFLKKVKIKSYCGCLLFLIDIRNTVAAHSNKNPPIEKEINVYVLYEIQEYLKKLILRYMNVGI